MWSEFAATDAYVTVGIETKVVYMTTCRAAIMRPFSWVRASLTRNCSPRLCNRAVVDLAITRDRVGLSGWDQGCR